MATTRPENGADSTLLATLYAIERILLMPSLTEIVTEKFPKSKSSSNRAGRVTL